MENPTRILIVEDMPTDAELAQREISRTLKSCKFQRVDTREAYRKSLKEFNPDLIISDYRMPQFNGLTALKLALTHAPLTPVIILTGAINEDTAVECMKAGATDYVIKEHIKRLGQAVIQALENKKMRLERLQAEESQAKLEAQLRQAQKMESIGLLAGGIAHDFNNLLAVIQSYGQLIEMQMSDDDPQRNRVKQILLASERAATLTQQLLAFSRKQILKPAPLNLNEVIANLKDMLVRVIGEEITLSTSYQPDLHLVTADRGQIEQVIVNIVINARDAMPNGGQLTIETSNIYLEESQTYTDTDALVGPCVSLVITDTGCGMDEKTMLRIFEPFFTTKKPGQGSGLGLATVYGIVKQSGGNIHVFSELGQGTTFKIHLPAREESTNDSPPSPEHPKDHEQNATILVIENQEILRNLTRSILKPEGHTVLEARNGAEALSLVKQYEETIDLLITDMVMPGMSGQEVVEQVKVLHPKIKVIFTSGYTDGTVVRHGIYTDEVNFLPKPFTIAALTSKVREVLNQ